MEESFAMNGGDGRNSYTQNSKYQAVGLDQAKLLLTNSIHQNLDIQTSRTAFYIADLGCSVGPNTFSSIETITETVALKYKQTLGVEEEEEEEEFLVFFNDQVTNDFNTLFQSLPADRRYIAAAVPGCFYGRLFPRSTINIFHSAFALHWLTQVPDEVKRPESPAWNPGKITYAESCERVVKAYSGQFQRDIRAFLQARSSEMADNGLLVILMPGRLEGTEPSEMITMHVFECLGHALVDMCNEGLVEKALLDSFNMPIFIPTASEVIESASLMEDLSVEVVREIHFPPRLKAEDIGPCCAHVRAVSEGILKKQFGSAASDMMFERLPRKLEDFSKSTLFTSTTKMANLFLLIKKKKKKKNLHVSI